MKKTLISIGVTVIYALVAYWFMLPAINLRSKEFYFYLITICAVYLILSLIFKGQRVINDSISQKKVNLSGFRSSHLVTKILLGCAGRRHFDFCRIFPRIGLSEIDAGGREGFYRGYQSDISERCAGR